MRGSVGGGEEDLEELLRRIMNLRYAIDFDKEEEEEEEEGDLIGVTSTPLVARRQEQRGRGGELEGSGPTEASPGTGQARNAFLLNVANVAHAELVEISEEIGRKERVLVDRSGRLQELCGAVYEVLAGRVEEVESVRRRMEAREAAMEQEEGRGREREEEVRKRERRCEEERKTMVQQSRGLRKRVQVLRNQVQCLQREKEAVERENGKLKEEKASRESKKVSVPAGAATQSQRRTGREGQREIGVQTMRERDLLEVKGSGGEGTAGRLVCLCKMLECCARYEGNDASAEEVFVELGSLAMKWWGYEEQEEGERETIFVIGQGVQRVNLVLFRAIMSMSCTEKNPTGRPQSHFRIHKVAGKLIQRAVSTSFKDGLFLGRGTGTTFPLLQRLCCALMLYRIILQSHMDTEKESREASLAMIADVSELMVSSVFPGIKKILLNGDERNVNMQNKADSSDLLLVVMQALHWGLKTVAAHGGPSPPKKIEKGKVKVKDTQGLSPSPFLAPLCSSLEWLSNILLLSFDHSHNHSSGDLQSDVQTNDVDEIFEDLQFTSNLEIIWGGAFQHDFGNASAGGSSSIATTNTPTALEREVFPLPLGQGEMRLKLFHDRIFDFLCLCLGVLSTFKDALAVEDLVHETGPESQISCTRQYQSYNHPGGRPAPESRKTNPVHVRATAGKCLLSIAEKICVVLERILRRCVKMGRRCGKAMENVDVTGNNGIRALGGKRFQSAGGDEAHGHDHVDGNLPGITPSKSGKENCDALDTSFPLILQSSVVFFLHNHSEFQQRLTNIQEQLVNMRSVRPGQSSASCSNISSYPHTTGSSSYAHYCTTMCHAADFEFICLNVSAILSHCTNILSS
eukprot:Nk52_evm19s48 gene=Nk52_evmTU19s48